MGLGGFDTKHPLSLHMLGMHGTASANYAVDDCDLLIALGARFDDRVAGVPAKFAPKAKRILHFDIDPSEIHKVKKADWHHVGLLPARARRARRVRPAHGLQRRTSTRGTTRSRQLEVHLRAQLRPRQPARAAAVRDRDDESSITQGEAIISSGVGQHQMWAAQYFDFREPRLVADVGQHGHDGLRPARRDRRAVRATPASS